MSTTAPDQQQRQAARWLSQKTEGSACELCRYDTGKPDEYIVVPTRLFSEQVQATIYGKAQPDPYTLLCCECDQRESQEKHEKERPAS